MIKLLISNEIPETFNEEGFKALKYTDLNGNPEKSKSESQEDTSTPPKK